MSSVPKSKRGQSGFEYFNNLYELNERLMYIVAHNFGLSDINNELKAFANYANMTDKDKNSFIWIATKYKIDVVNQNYYIVDYYKGWLLRCYRILAEKVISANTIYPTNDYEVYRKRELISQAIEACEMMIQIMQFAMQVLPINPDYLIPLTSNILNEKDQLKNWKKSTSKMLSKNKQQPIPVIISQDPIALIPENINNIETQK